MPKNNSRGIAQVLILIAALGLIVFILIASTGSFKDNLFGRIFPKSQSKASEPLNSAQQVKVLVMRYFPLDSSGTRLDASIADTGADLETMRAFVSNITDQGLASLTEGTRYHGGPAYATYSKVDDKEFLKVIPKPSGIPVNQWSAPDYRKMLTEDVNVCDYVDGQGVSQVWIWGYHASYIAPTESDMAMGRASQAFWNHGTYGDASNSSQSDNMPVCNKTYVMYNYNYTRGLGELLEDHGHQIEALMRFVDNSLWDKFVNPHGSGTTVNHCGWTHSPPNVTDANQYYWESPTEVQSDCEDWRPEGGGQVKTVSCHTWDGANCYQNGGSNFKVWWMKQIPGWDNTVTYQGAPLRNWWEFYVDLDSALAVGKGLVIGTVSPVPTPVGPVVTPVPATPSPTPASPASPTPTPAPCTTCNADINHDGVVDDTLDFGILTTCFGTTVDVNTSEECRASDINRDGYVTISDFSCLRSRLDQVCQANVSATPTPTPSPVPTATPAYACSACRADLNRDGVVDDTVDYGIFQSCFGTAVDNNTSTECRAADINGDGNVTIVDFSCLRAQIDKQCASNVQVTPTPSPVSTPIADISFGGRVFLDVNRDGVLNNGEDGISGREIKVNGNVFCTTGQDGACSRFGIVSVGTTYTVSHTPPVDFVATSNESVTVTASGGPGGAQIIPFGIAPRPSGTPGPTPTPNSTVTFITGDINRNGRVDVFDFNILISDFGKSDTVSRRSDLNRNGRVDVFDFSILIQNFGRSN